MTQRKNYKVMETSCPECDGYGVVADYGTFCDDFYGPKECPFCKGKVSIKERVFVK